VIGKDLKPDTTISAESPSPSGVAAPSRKTQLLGGAIALATGVLVAAMIYTHPEELRVPAWVAYTAAMVFVLAGLALLAGAWELGWLQRWGGAGVALALFFVSGWIAFGPGERECTVSMPFFRTFAADAVCRGAFGFGTLLVGLLLGLVAYRAIRGRSS
jgi:hypothetical protein